MLYYFFDFGVRLKAFDPRIKCEKRLARLLRASFVAILIDQGLESEHKGFSWVSQVMHDLVAEDSIVLHNVLVAV